MRNFLKTNRLRVVKFCKILGYFFLCLNGIIFVTLHCNLIIYQQT